ncbi:hypothetical protein M3147_18460 [Agromyces mediolanus]|uniref:hypothetical protein n=1 Tax=Agromyces mediolanus TaxID=41986 RepID=UPI00203D4CF2|nr:hypothetical protein [Agromyces mediolanus]MCM3659241.1 hypothetical protein [Agromyces mediolanus]
MTAATDAPGAGSKREQKTRERNLGRVRARAAVVDARAEFASTLNALEDKLNVPKQLGIRVDRAKVKARVFADRNPAGAVAVAIGAVVVVAGVVALVVRAAVSDD